MRNLFTSGRAYAALAALVFTIGAVMYVARVHRPSSRVADGSDATAGDSAQAYPSRADAGSAPGAASTRNVSERSWAFYSSRPSFQRPRPPTKVPAGLPDMRAETCGSCHKAIYREWKLSTHSHAWLDDAQFQAELRKSRGVDDPHTQDDVGWMCVNCHTPNFRQLPEVVVGLKKGDISRPVYADNPTFDVDLQDEAITCATCHVRNGIVYGPYAGLDAPHPTAKDPDLRSERVCTRCHNVQAQFPRQNLGCFFSTGEEWASSRYGAADHYCEKCHMPQVRRKLAADFDRPARLTRHHWFGGSLIPKKPAYADDLKRLRKVYGTAVEIALIEPESDTPPAGEHDPNFGTDSTRCAANQPCTRLWVRLTNKNAGHDFPTGDPERHADITVVARDAHGKTIARASDRIAAHYQWWPTVKKLSTNRIPPGDHHDIVLEVPGAHRAFTVAIVGRKFRMYKKAFEHHHLDGKYVRGRTFHTSTWKVDKHGHPTLQQVSDDWGTRTTLAHDWPEPR